MAEQTVILSTEQGGAGLVVASGEVGADYDARLGALVEEVVDNSTRIVSDHTRYVYTKNIEHFLNWRTESGLPLARFSVERYAREMVDSGMSKVNVNHRLVAIRHLARRAQLAGYITFQELEQIERIPGFKVHDTKTGNWLSEEEARALVAAPDTSTKTGKRDRAIVHLMLDTGLRRAEVASLTVDHLKRISAVNEEVGRKRGH
jgi:site-specific recombinase XerD